MIKFSAMRLEHTPTIPIAVRESETPIDLRFERLYAVNADWAQTPPLGDERLGSLGRATQIHLATDPAVSDLFEHVMQERPAMSSSYMLTLWARCLQKIGLEIDAAYPVPYTDRKKWSSLINTIMDEPKFREELVHNMTTLNLQSNKPERYKGPKMIAVLAYMQGTIGELALLDIGSSLCAGPNKLVSGTPFDESQFVSLLSGTEDLRRTRQLNAMANYPLPIKHITCVDTEDREAARSWGISNSFYPSELLDKRAYHEFIDTVDARPDNVTFVQTDITKPSTEAAARLDSRRHNVVSLVTMLYQLEPQDRVRVLEECLDRTERLLIVQEHAFIDPHDPSRLVIPDDWRKLHYPYRTFVMDKAAPKQEWCEGMRWSDARMTHATVGLGKLALGHGTTRSYWRTLAQALTAP